MSSFLLVTFWLKESISTLHFPQDDDQDTLSAAKYVSKTGVVNSMKTITILRVLILFKDIFPLLKLATFRVGVNFCFSLLERNWILQVSWRIRGSLMLPFRIICRTLESSRQKFISLLKCFSLLVMRTGSRHQAPREGPSAAAHCPVLFQKRWILCTHESSYILAQKMTMVITVPS